MTDGQELHRRDGIEHDANGNRAVRSGGSIGDHDYDYDWDDRVRRVEVNGGDAVEFGYDAGGRRTIERRGPLDAQGQITNPTVTRFYSDMTGSGKIQKYLLRQRAAE